LHPHPKQNFRIGKIKKEKVKAIDGKYHLYQKIKVVILIYIRKLRWSFSSICISEN